MNPSFVPASAVRLTRSRAHLYPTPHGCGTIFQPEIMVSPPWTLLPAGSAHSYIMFAREILGRARVRGKNRPVTVPRQPERPLSPSPPSAVNNVAPLKDTAAINEDKTRQHPRRAAFDADPFLCRRKIFGHPVALVIHIRRAGAASAAGSRDSPPNAACRVVRPFLRPFFPSREFSTS